MIRIQADDPPSRFFATMGLVSDPQSMGGTPYNFWRAINASGLPVAPLDLPRETGVVSRRTLWWLKQGLRLDAPFGYRFSADSQEHAWLSAGPLPERSEIINNFQLFPPSIIRQAEAGRLSLRFFIDLTLRELFAGYPSERMVSRRRRSAAIRLETEGYLAARRITVFSSRSAEVLRCDYGIKVSKIDVIVPGANIDDDIANAIPRVMLPERTGDLIVGFVGMDYRRKGLLPLAEAILALRRKGVRVRLRVVGPVPEQLRDRDGIDLIGRINKSRDMQRFVEMLAGCHLGALPSAAEGCPISLLEFLRLGIPVIATRVNGIPDVVNGRNGILVDPALSVADLADVLGEFARNPAKLEPHRQAAWEYRDYASWRRVAAEFRASLSGEHSAGCRRNA